MDILNSFLNLPILAKIFFIIGLMVLVFVVYYHMYKTEAPIKKVIIKESEQQLEYMEFVEEIKDIFREQRDLGLEWSSVVESCDQCYDSYLYRYPENQLIKDFYNSHTWRQWYKILGV